MPSSPPPSVPVAPGDVLAGKYLVEQVLGAGGMGVVVAAMHQQLGQRVALKFLLPAGMANAQVVTRFEREARAAAQLKSEHVARVIDVGRMDGPERGDQRGAPYIVMELLKGCDLGALLEDRGPLAEAEAADYVIQACEAIAEAHAAGIIHRDLKPKNLFVTRTVDGAPLVKVLDFGISKVRGANDLSLTGTAEVIGSPNYMSPEQLKASRDVDARSDIWSIGAILYELLGGEVPFVAETLTQLCSLVISEPPRPLEELRPDVHPELRRVIGKCLEKDKANRFPSVGELAMALAPFATPAGSALASRVAIVASGSQGSVPAAASHSGRIPLGGPGGSTSVSWGATQLQSAPNRRKVAFTIVASAAVAAMIGAAFPIRRLGNPTSAGTASPVLTISVTPPAALPVSTSVPATESGGPNSAPAPIAASAAPAPTAPATSAAAPAVSVPMGTRGASTPRPPATPTPTLHRAISNPKPNADDLPTD